MNTFSVFTYVLEIDLRVVSALPEPDVEDALALRKIWPTPLAATLIEPECSFNDSIHVLRVNESLEVGEVFGCLLRYARPAKLSELLTVMRLSTFTFGSALYALGSACRVDDHTVRFPREEYLWKAPKIFVTKSLLHLQEVESSLRYCPEEQKRLEDSPPMDRYMVRRGREVSSEFLNSHNTKGIHLAVCDFDPPS